MMVDRPYHYIKKGNHRILDAERDNVSFLQAKLYCTDNHINYLIPYSKLVFKICCNIINYSLFVENKIDDAELRSLLYDL